jgi:hypothetical protein
MKPSDGPKVAQLCSDRIETLCCVSVQRWHRPRLALNFPELWRPGPADSRGDAAKCSQVARMMLPAVAFGLAGNFGSLITRLRRRV